MSASRNIRAALFTASSTIHRQGIPLSFLLSFFSGNGFEGACNKQALSAVLEVQVARICRRSAFPRLVKFTVYMALLGPHHA